MPAKVSDRRISIPAKIQSQLDWMRERPSKPIDVILEFAEPGRILVRAEPELHEDLLNRMYADPLEAADIMVVYEPTAINADGRLHLGERATQYLSNPKEATDNQYVRVCLRAGVLELWSAEHEVKENLEARQSLSLG